MAMARLGPPARTRSGAPWGGCQRPTLGWLLIVIVIVIVIVIIIIIIIVIVSLVILLLLLIIILIIVVFAGCPWLAALASCPWLAALASCPWLAGLPDLSRLRPSLPPYHLHVSTGCTPPLVVLSRRPHGRGLPGGNDRPGPAGHAFRSEYILSYQADGVFEDELIFSFLYPILLCHRVALLQTLSQPGPGPLPPPAGLTQVRRGLHFII